MSTSVFPERGDFIFTDDFRGSGLISGGLVSDCYVLRDDRAAHLVFSTPALAGHQVGNVRDHLSTVIHSAYLALLEDVEQPMSFYECHAPALNTASACVLYRLTVEGSDVVREKVPHPLAAGLIRRCFALARGNYGLSPSPEVEQRLRQAHDQGGKVIPFPGRR